MDEVARSPQIVRFGVFEADLQTGELRKNGVRVPLQGQPFQVCAILLEHSGELVTREELRQQVWPEDTFVDFDHALNTAITKIRLALGDEADNPRFVETLPRRGYRFIGPVDKPSFQAPSPSAPKGRFEGHTARSQWMFAGATFLALLCGIGIWRFARNGAEAPLPPIEVAPLVGLPGFESEPAFSPDGNQVAFALGEPENSGIYTTMVGGEKSLRLTSNFGDCCPRWSPDGRQVAFSRTADEGGDIYVIPSLGGTEHRLLPSPPEGHRISTVPPWRFSGRSLDWSPNGKVVAFSDSQPDKIKAYVTARSEPRLWSCFLARRLDRSFRPRDCCRCGGGSLRRAHGRWCFEAADLRQRLDLWASHLDSGRSRYRILVHAWRSRESLAHTRFRRNTTAGSGCRCDRGIPFHFSKR
jgi:DNA-binding winged helix-turn-helix (wHTH) protein